MAAPPRITSAAIDQDGVANIAYASGADMTGVSSNAVQAQVALDLIAAKYANGILAGGILLFPAGTRSKIDATLNYTADGPISIIGGNGTNRNNANIIQAPSCATLFNLSSSRSDAEANSQQHVEIGGVCIAGNAPGPGTICFKIYNPKTVYAHDIQAAEGAGFWSKFFDLLNVRTSVFERYYIRNDHGIVAGAAKSGGGTYTLADQQNDIKGVMFNMNATVGSTDNRFNDMFVQGFDSFFTASMNTAPSIERTICEGVAILCNSGFTWVYGGPAGYIPPQLQFLNRHMNCQKYWITASGVADIIVSNSQLELHNELGYGSNNGFTFTNVERFDISHNTMVMSRPASLIVTAGTTNLGMFTNNKGIATATTAVQQYISLSRNIISRDNCFAVSPGTTLWTGDSARNLQNLNNTAMFIG